MTARFDKLIEIVKLYQREANRCRMAKAHVSGCIALGAVLEAQLLALCILYRHHLRLSPTFVGKIKTGRVLWKVSLHDLIEVARELDWLPRTAKYKGKSIADWAHLVREIRDLAHAGRWVRKYKKEKIGAAHFRMSYEILRTLSEHLEHVIYMTWKRRGLI